MKAHKPDGGLSVKNCVVDRVLVYEAGGSNLAQVPFFKCRVKLT